jgi:serine/threonine protein kinase
MRSDSAPPGAAAMLRHTVVFPQGSAPNQLPRVLPRRSQPVPVAQPPHPSQAHPPHAHPPHAQPPLAARPQPNRPVPVAVPGWPDVDEDEETDLRPMAGADPVVRRGRRAPDVAGSNLIRPARRDAIGPGTIIGNYRVIEPLANGGMGVVFVAEHLHLRRKVALKLLHDRLLSDAWAVSRFFSEAVAASRIQHPGAVTVFDYGTFAGGAYLVMEYLRGETLSARLQRERRLPIPRILDVGVQLGLTLAAAHESGVVHRDLKPDNIYLVADASGSGYEYVKVIDFGVAKLMSGTWAPQTLRGDLLGTPLYMAPEQSVNAGTVDQRCDIYSLGCILYQLITGIPPFRGSMFEILIAHQKEPTPAPRSYDPTIPPALDVLVRRMMNKSPDGRPASMAEVVRALSSIARDERLEPTRPPARRTGAAWLGLGLGVGLIVAGLVHLAALW